MQKNRLVQLLLLAFFVLHLSGGALSAATTGENPSDKNQGELFQAPVPIIYGEAGFIDRIQKRLSDSVKGGKGREPLGLVLSGGSARAFAHIGVLQYLEEQGIVPDFIVSNSMGSIVGLLYGAGLSPSQIYELVSTTDIGALFSLTAPAKGGILDVSKFTDLLFSYLGPKDLKDLPVPVMVLCEDLRTKREIRIAEGDFYDVMEAAYALPVYFSPIPYYDHRLIDGGITNLVPLAPAYRYTSQIIASTTFYENPELDLENPLTILNVSIDIGKRRQGVIQLQEYEPLLIRCDVESFSFMDFAAIDAIYAAGYASAKNQYSELMQIEAGGISKEQQLIRETFEVSKQDVLQKLSYFGRIESRTSSNHLSLSLLDSFIAPQDATRIFDDYGITAGYVWDYPALQLEIAGGGFFDPYGTDALAAGFQTRLAAYPHPRLRTELLSRITLQDNALSSMGTGNYSAVIDSMKTEGNVVGVLFQQAPFRVEMQASGGFAMTNPGNLQSGYAGAAVTGIVKSGNAVLPSYGKLQTGYRWENLSEHVFYGEFSGRVPLFSSFALRTAGIGIITPKQGGSVGFSHRDQYRSTLAVGRYPVIAGTSIETLWVPVDWSPSFGEFILFQDLHLGLYGDLLYSGTANWGAGVLAGISVSLIGLESSYLQAYAGYDSIAQGPVGGIVFGLQPQE